MSKSRSLKNKLITWLGLAGLFFTVSIVSISYALYSTNVIAYTEKQIETSNTQSLVNYETYFNSAISISSSIQSKFENTKIDKDDSGITQYLDDISSFKKDIRSLTYYDSESGELLAHSSRFYESNEPKNKDWFKFSIDNPLITIFSSINEYETGDYGFTLSKYINTNNGLDHGVLKIDYNFNEMATLISKTDLGLGGHITIYDKNYNVVFCSGNHSVEESDYVKNIVLGSGIATINGVKYSTFISTISRTSWRVAIFTNYSEISNAINTFIITIITLGIVLLALFALITIAISKQITKPLVLLQSEMEKFTSLNYDIEKLYNIHGSSEIESLSNSFNKMLYRIKDLASKLIVESENKRISELKALQNQINPHFLYNTLDSIVYLIDEDEKEKATQMIIALSKFFRISISKGRNVIPFSKEIEHVTNYLLIQKIRFGKQFEYTIDFDERILDVPVIKLILQPIVENSIIHGFNELEYVGKISITGRIVGDLIRIDIKDNGYGILPENIEKIYNSFHDDSVHDGVGFKNVYQRLRIYYGEKADIKIESNLDMGTDVIIFIPYNGGKNNE